MNNSDKPEKKTLRKIENLQRRIISLEKKGKALKKERETLYSLLDSIPGFVFLRAQDYSIRFENQYFLEHFGVPTEKPCYEIITNRQEPCDECKILEVFNTKKPQKWEWCNKISNKFYQIYDFPFRNIEGELLVLEFGIDITELKEKEEQIRILSAREQEKILLMSMQSRQASMGEMIGNIAHEWRQPLNIIALLIQDLRESYDAGKFTRKYLDDSINKTMDVIQYMSQTIEDFSNFFTPEKEKTLFSVHDAIHRAISFLNPELKRREFLIEIDVPEDILINGYPNEYGHVLLNIIRNAKDEFVERNTLEPKISINAFKESDKVVVTITDNAGGISDDIIDKVFDPYFTTKGSGIGIGLHMSKIIIERNMEGNLSVRNVENGAEFRIAV